MRTYHVTLTGFTTTWHPAEAKKKKLHRQKLCDLKCSLPALKLLHKDMWKRFTCPPKPGCWHLPDIQDMAGTTQRQIHTRMCHRSHPASQGRIKLPQAHSKQVYSKWPATAAEHCSKHACNGQRDAFGSGRSLIAISRSSREYNCASESLTQSPQRATQ